MMGRMRAAIVALLLATLVSGCASGYLMGLRQDKLDRVAMSRVLARQTSGEPFAARRLLVKPWTRLWVFSDRATAQGIEDRTGVPFPRTEQPVARGASYLVFVDAEQVLSAFTLPPARTASVTCLRSQRPLRPDARLVLERASRAVVVAGGQGRCGRRAAG